MIRVLGVDPGFAQAGWSVIQVELGSQVSLSGRQAQRSSVIAAGRFQTEKSAKKLKVNVGDDDWRRTKELASMLVNVIQDYDIKLVCMESMSSPPNSMTSKKIAFFIGAVAAICQVLDVPCTQITPKRIKKMLCGRINVTDEKIREALDELYPELAKCLDRVKLALSYRQHPYDATGAVHCCWNDEHFVAVRRMML